MDSSDEGEDLLGSPSPHALHGRRPSSFFPDVRHSAGGSEHKGKEIIL